MKWFISIIIILTLGIFVVTLSVDKKQVTMHYATTLCGKAAVSFLGANSSPYNIRYDYVPLSLDDALDPYNLDMPDTEVVKRATRNHYEDGDDAGYLISKMAIEIPGSIKKIVCNFNYTVVGSVSFEGMSVDGRLVGDINLRLNTDSDITLALAFIREDKVGVIDRLFYVLSPSFFYAIRDKT